MNQKQIASRAVLVKAIYEYWDQADSFDTLIKKMDQYPKDFFDSHKAVNEYRILPNCTAYMRSSRNTQQFQVLFE